MFSEINWQTAFTGIAAIVAIFSLFLTFHEKKRQQHDAIIRSFQEDKEAVAYIAFQILLTPRISDPDIPQ